ncbi:MAG: hypothetical protein WCP55_08875, partial [Lentisphaerota bacterium]
MERERFSPSLSSRSQVFFAAAKERALNAAPSPRMVNRTKAFFEICKAEPLRRRQALSFAYELKNESACVFDGLLIGQIYQCKELPWDSSR